MNSSDIHLNTIAHEILQPPINKMSLKITYLKLHLNLPGANELTNIESGPRIPYKMGLFH